MRALPAIVFHMCFTVTILFFIFILEVYNLILQGNSIGLFTFKTEYQEPDIDKMCETVSPQES